LKLNFIELRNFRNYAVERFVLEPYGNLIIGPNGSGKTNLLEAMAYTAMGKSIRYHQDSDLINTKGSFFAISAGFQTDLQLPLDIHLAYDGKRKVLKINKDVKRQLSSLFDVVKIIYCAPEDIQLVNGSPRLRRQHFDLAISQVFPAYIGTLREYLHVVEQRNKLLKSDYLAAEKRSWDLRFAKCLSTLYPFREKYLQLLNSELRGAYKDVSINTKDLIVQYVPVLREAMQLSEAELLQHLELYEPREKMWQRSLFGAHLDDYSFRMGNFGMRAFASQGQKRIAVIVMKMIQAQLIESNTRIKPIMLFDDVFAELDYDHGQKIHDLCKDSYQIFIASPKEDVRQIFGKMKVIRLGQNV
jgi:DNA replication and repair protein RecF